jgi:surface protein
MFYGCSNLAEVDLSHFDTSNVWTMNSMFENCSALKTIYNDDAWTYSYSDYMFFGCVSLKGAISYDAEKTDVTYANPTTGYFTSKNNPVTVLSGDVNGDGNITVADAVGIISYILGDAPDGFIEAAADVNQDDKVTVADAVAVMSMIQQ